MVVAKTLANLSQNFISFDEISEELDSRRNRDPLEEFEEHVSNIAKFDPEDEVADVDELYRRLVDQEGASYDSVQIGGTFGVESDHFMDWVEAAGDLSEMMNEDGLDVDLSVLAEPSEQSHVMNLEAPERAVLSPDFFTVPRITNTDEEEYRHGAHQEFIGWTEAYIHEEGAEEIITRYVTNELKNAVEEKVSNANGWKNSIGNKVLESGILDEIAVRETQNYLDQTEDFSGNSEAAETILWDIFWSQWITEDYFVTNPEASVATKTGADEWLEGKNTVDLMHHVQDITYQSAKAEEPGYLNQNLLYIEGSGAQTPFEIIRAADLAREKYGLDIQIIYGGGIENGENQPDLIKHDNEDLSLELEYSLTDEQLREASFDPENFEDLKYDPDKLDGEQQKDLVLEAGADAYIQGNSIQIN